MGVNDGMIIGATKILNNGPDNQRMNIVLVAEGFKATQQNAFDTLCTEFVAALQAEPWYPAVGGALNVWKLNVSSTDEGADDPAGCPDEAGDGTVVNTYFDATFCKDGINHRCLGVDWGLVMTTLNAQIPVWYAGAVIVNTMKRGGCAQPGTNVFATGLGVKPDGEKWTDVALHEFGHAAFNLADEYPYGKGNIAPAFEPFKPNITITTSRAGLEATGHPVKKLWADMITPEVPVPTMENPNCMEEDESPNVLDSDFKIGLFEGAGYYHCDLYRPAYLCRMRVAKEPFCGVCIQGIADALKGFVTPTPRMEVVTGDGSLLLDFGDVVHGLTMYRSFEVRNNRMGFPGTLRVDLSAITGEFSYAPGTDLSFTLPAPLNEPYTSRTVFVAFTSTNVGGPVFPGSLQVTTPDDPMNPLVTVDLLARAVAPPPVDTVLVFDRSGSMGGATGVPGKRKVDLAIEAGQLYASLIKDNDRIGVVRFNHNAGDPADILLNMQVAGAPGDGLGRDDTVTVLNDANLNPTGDTSIGGGILLGSKVLDSAVAPSRALIVLTDGIQNTDPDIPEATAEVLGKSPKQRVFAVGLGLNQLEDKLEQIASVTNGVAQITGDLAGFKEFLLQKLYVQILSDVSDEAFVKDPVSIVMPGEKRATKVYLGEIDVTADFIVVFRRAGAYPKHVRIWLEAPDGTLITAANVGSFPNVDLVNGKSHMFFRWVFPAFPDRPEGHIGCWRVWVENFGRGATTAATGAGEPFYYSVMCKARSNLRLGGHLTQASYAPGSTMTLTLEPTLFGLPVKLNNAPEAHVVRPDGVVRTLPLQPGPYGEYTGEFTDTPLVGPYLFSTEVSATSPAGNYVTRFRQFTGLIFRPGKPGGTGGKGGTGDPGDCREIGVLIRRLGVLFDKCCCHEETTPPAVAALSTSALLDVLRRRIEDERPF